MFNCLKNFLAFLIVFVFAGSLVFCFKNQTWKNAEINFFRADKMAGFVPKGENIKKITIGFDNFLADLYWLRSVQFSGANVRDFSFDSLYEYLDLITDLDPYFEGAYLQGSYLLPLANKLEEADLILQKGEENLPHNWQIFWNHGFLKYYYLNDYEGAIFLYEECLKIEGCLKGAERTIINLQAKTGKYEIALQEWLRIYENQETDENTRELAKLKIEETAKIINLNKLANEFVGEINSITDLKKYYENLNPVIQKQKTSPVLIEVLKVFPDMNSDPFYTPFEKNPFYWDQEKKIVRTKNW